MTKTAKTDRTENGFPEEVDMEGLSKLLSSLPDDVVLEIVTEAGLTDGGEPDDRKALPS